MRVCGVCAAPLTDRQRVFCSTPCLTASQRGGWRRADVLDILRGNVHSWMSASDVAIWVYGDDRRTEINAARQCIYQLRRDGHVIESRPVTWGAWTKGCPRAYRLIEAVAEAAA